ncbi:UNVERIFIED_CONTAM: hypothetical protein FKN15_027989 [Acipenser sinensis]
MSDSQAQETATAAPTDSTVAAPAGCQAIKTEMEKCIKDKGEESCKDLIEAYKACLKSLGEKA